MDNQSYEVPTLPRSRVSATIKGLIGIWNYQDLAYGDAETLILGVNSAKEPDSWVRPKGRSRSPLMQQQITSYPTMVIEVDHRQGLPGLHRK
jgi:hypothetical protein